MFHGARDVIAERYEQNAIEPIGRLRAFGDGDLRRLIDRISVNAAADRRKRDRSHAVFLPEAQAVSITRSEQLSLAVIAAAPAGPDGVNHMLRGQPIAAGDSRLACRTSADLAALLEELRSGRAMNRA